MKKTLIQLPLFLVLILAIIVGLSYLSLDQANSTEEAAPKEDRMSIALVNEDDGAVFNDSDVDFGEAFVKSINQQNHEWYVVSRGVAESGIERNTYDMMIVIPNDFTEKAISINSEAPEQVVLNYKINASDSEAIRAKAEETASNILNDFNRRIIDVYFASVIGNLQDAQDNVAKIVEDYESLTATYNQNVQNPLSSYTSQFSTIKDSTEISKDQFSVFEDTLKNYEQSLVEQLSNYEDYQTNIDDVRETQQSNSLLTNDFAEQLNNFKNQLDNGDINSQLQNLQDVNDYMNLQFQLIDENEQNTLDTVALHSRGLQNRLNQALEDITAEKENFDIEEIRGRIDERLNAIIAASFDDEDDDLTTLLGAQDDRLLSGIEDQISQLPTLDENIWQDADLSPEMIQEIKNVIGITNKYQTEFNEVYSSNHDVILPEHIQNLKEDLHYNGVTLSDTVMLPESDKPLREFKVHGISEGFAIRYLVVHLPDGEEVRYTNYQEGETVQLPGYQNGEFTVQLTLELEEEFLDEPINIFEMKQWKWDMYQIDEEEANQLEEEETEEETSQVASKTIYTPIVASYHAIKAENGEEVTDKTNQYQVNTVEKESSSASINEDESGGTPDDSVEVTDETPVEDEVPNDGSGEGTEVPDDGSTTPGDQNGEETEDGSTDPGDGNGEEIPEEEEPQPEPVIELVEINHHHIQHTVTAPVIDEYTEGLIHTVENTITPYQRLLASYESYFGISLSCANVEEGACPDAGGDETLLDMATDDSIYALLNKNVGDLLTDYIATKVTDDVLSEVNEPLENYERDVENHRAFIERTLLRADQLADKVTNSREVARKLNEQLIATIEDITAWREESLNLIDSQTEIQNANEQEQNMVMSLGEGYQPLFTQSQTLADQASGNLTEAETVYQTFDRIDEQAETIGQSGTGIIEQAEVLAENLTAKVMDDQAFADNFSEVMANSRIGDRQNEDLYEFLSNPVETKNAGVIVERETFSAYFLVLITFLAALFTAYGISTVNQKRIQENAFEEESSIFGRNALVAGITAGLGVIEGIVFGLVSAYLLDISGGKLIIWTLLMVLIMTVMVLAASYLLRQLKLVGMFILLGIMSLYLFLTNALSAGLSNASEWREYSPLQYVERLLNRFVHGSSDYGMIVLSLILVLLIAVLANLLVISKQSAQRKEGDENAA
ncbi:type VII secretion protein EsaA [Gracilibacillus kekensis]|uniref:Type VII secretion system accessory factor EsaA n=1 Tax=Gracilibacillus kekensis TaxID=1027249 RepID=A0A1M7JPX7_9BACI|nr:type VII secretion protein EsaA [Gracilibacillus kekensis]SHM55149.1 type VII secretion protein EsaA, N-terminal domain-containing protein [Gracilibacillus kekensis]